MKSFGSSEGPYIMSLDLMLAPPDLTTDSTVCLSTVCLIQEEMVEGEISLLKFFLKETKTSSFLSLRSLVLSR